MTLRPATVPGLTLAVCQILQVDLAPWYIFFFCCAFIRFIADVIRVK